MRRRASRCRIWATTRDGRPVWVVFTVLVTRHGSRTRRRSFRREADAVAWYHDQLAWIASGRVEGPSDWLAACDLYVAHRTAKGDRSSTLRRLRAQLRAVTATLRELHGDRVDPYQLTVEDAAAHVRRRIRAGRSRATVDGEVAAVAAMQRWMQAEGWITADDVTWASVPVPGAARGKATLDAAERGRWFRSALQLARRPGLRRRVTPWNRWGCAAGLLLHGLRTAELVHLRVGDIDLDAALVWVRDREGARTKSDASDRGVPLVSEELLEELRRVYGGGRGGGPEAYAFPGARGRALSERTDWFRLRTDRTCDEARTRRVVPHGVRHSTATGSVVEGAGIAQLATLLGHADATVTSRVYDHARAVELRAAWAPYGRALDEAVRRGGRALG